MPELINCQQCRLVRRHKCSINADLGTNQGCFQQDILNIDEEMLLDFPFFSSEYIRILSIL